MNHVTISGNLGRDPELRFNPSGNAQCTFSVAVNERRGEENETHWFDVICYKKLAENVAETIQSGTNVIVSGKLQQRTWDDKEGKKHSKVEIVAWNVAPDLAFATATVTKNERFVG